MIRILTIFTLSLTSLLFSTIQLSVGTVDDTNGSIEILINTDVDIMGFQFDLEGANLTGGSGGLAESNGFDIYASGNTTLGFSLDGDLIPAASNGILTILDGSIIGDVCLPFVQDVLEKLYLHILLLFQYMLVCFQFLDLTFCYL